MRDRSALLAAALLAGCWSSTEPAVVVEVPEPVTGCTCTASGDGTVHVELIDPSGESVAADSVRPPARVALPLPELAEPEDGWTVFVWADCGHPCSFEPEGPGDRCCGGVRRVPVVLEPRTTVRVDVSL